MRIWDTLHSPGKRSCISPFSPLQKPSPCSQGRPWSICHPLLCHSISGKPLSKGMRFWDCQLLFTKIMSIHATMSSSASAPSLLLSTLRVLSHAHWALGWRSQTLILLWRGWSRQQAALKPYAPSVWSWHPWIEAPWTMQCSRPSYNHSSGFLSARRPSQYISELLFLSYDHIIPGAPCHSSRALHTLETLVACFPSGGSGLMYHLGH